MDDLARNVKPESRIDLNSRLIGGNIDPNSGEVTPQRRSSLGIFGTVINPCTIVALASLPAQVESVVPASTDLLFFPEIERRASGSDELACGYGISVNVDYPGSVDLKMMGENIVASVLEGIQVPIDMLREHDGSLLGSSCANHSIQYSTVSYSMSCECGDIPRETLVCSVEVFVGDTRRRLRDQRPVPTIPAMNTSVESDLPVMIVGRDMVDVRPVWLWKLRDGN